jgi:hypothetical protein
MLIYIINNAHCIYIIIMKRVVQTLAIHVFCILCFAFFYYYFSLHFDNNRQDKFTYYDRESKIESIIDFLLFSTTIQAGVGISDILPISVYGKLLMITQQLIMISISVITIYVFTK